MLVLSKILTPLVMILFLASCLDTTISMRLKSDGRIRTELTYRMDEEFAGFGRGFAAEEPWPLPVSEKIFRQRALLYPENRVLSYKTSTRDNSEIIRVRLLSSSISDLSDYLGLNLLITEEEGNSQLTLELPDSSRFQEASAENQESLLELVGDSTLTLEFRPPGRPQVSEPGVISGSVASLSLGIRDILNSPRGVWSVVW